MKKYSSPGSENSGLEKYDEINNSFTSKTIVTLILSIIIMASFTQCRSAQFDKNPPFTKVKAQYQDWIGGRPGSKGTLVTIELNALTSKDMSFDSIFFRKKKLKLDTATVKNTRVLTANFMVITPGDGNRIMHSDTRKEMTNEVPDVVVNFPFELADDACVISYVVKKKKYYFKLENLKKTKTLYYQ